MILGKHIQNRRTALILNFLSFQMGWFLCVWAGGANKSWLGIGVAAILLAFHVFALRPFLAECVLIVSIGLLGTALDSCLIALGIFIPLFPSAMPWLCPLWLTFLWMLFASVQTVSLRWLWGKPVLALLLGGVGGPMAYYGGYRLGAIEFGVNIVIAMASLSIIWAAVTYAIALFSARVDRDISQSTNRYPQIQDEAGESDPVARQVL